MLDVKIVNLEKDIEELKKQIEKEKKTAQATNENEPQKVTAKELQSQLNGYKKKLDELSAIKKVVDEFVSQIKPHAITADSPLVTMSKFLTLSENAKDSKIIDIDVKLEGLSIIKENIFTGQKLRLSAVGIVQYRLYDSNGKLIKAGIIRNLHEPVQIDLRGNNPDKEFWNKQYPTIKNTENQSH